MLTPLSNRIEFDGVAGHHLSTATCVLPEVPNDVAQNIDRSIALRCAHRSALLKLISSRLDRHDHPFIAAHR